MAVNVEISGLSELNRSWARLLTQFPKRKKKLLEQVGTASREDVAAGIKANQKSRPTGKVAKAQELYYGSKGGYVAVRPAANTFLPSGSSQYAAGYVTTAVDQGHKIRKSDASKAVPGKFFYDSARKKLQNRAEGVIEELTADLVDGLGGWM